MAEIISIYGLREVGTVEVRYVGQSGVVEERLPQHIRAADLVATNAKRLWVEDAKRRGVEIEMVTLEECGPDVDEVAREQYWIDYYRAEGHRLTNTRPSVQSRYRSNRAKAPVVLVAAPAAPVAVAAVKPDQMQEDYLAVETAAVDLLEMLVGRQTADIKRQAADIKRLMADTNELGAITNRMTAVANGPLDDIRALRAEVAALRQTVEALGGTNVPD